MKASLVAVGALLAGCGGDAGHRSTSREFEASSRTHPVVWNIVFSPDSVPYLLTDNGALRFDGSQFVPVQPELSIPLSGTTFSVEADGTMYAGRYRLRPGSTTWQELPDLPGAPFDRGPVVASDGSLYVHGSVGVDTDQLFRMVGDGPWVPVGAPTGSSSRLHVDAHGGVWFETTHDELFVARGDTVTFVMRSNYLGMVGPDATLYYFMGSPGDDALGTDAAFGPVMSITEAGVEKVLTRGSCVDAVWPCPHRADGLPGYLNGALLAKNGTFYQVWEQAASQPGFDPVMVMALSPGATSWHPVADITDGAPRGIPLGLYVAPNGTIWTSIYRQIGGINDDGSTINQNNSYVFRIDP